MKAKDILLVILGIYSLGMTITHCNRPKELITPLTDDHRTEPPETIYRVLRIPIKLPYTVQPSTVILPPNQSYSSQGSGTSHLINPDSVAAVELNTNSLKFTLQDTLGNLSQLDFRINPQRYQYTWVEGKLTSKPLTWHKKIQVKPYTGISYRPLNNLTDVELGINIKSEHLTYKAGIHGFYYPKFQNDPGWDLVIGIQYEF